MERELLLPYLYSQAIAIVFAAIAWKWPRVARFTIGIGFIFASVFNLWWAWHSPGVYVQAYGPHAIQLYRAFIYGAFSRHTASFVVAIAFGQMLSGVLTFTPLPWRRIGYAGMVVFFLAISPLGIGAGFPSSLFLALAVVWVSWRDRAASAHSAASA